MVEKEAERCRVRMGVVRSRQDQQEGAVEQWIPYYDMALSKAIWPIAQNTVPLLVPTLLEPVPLCRYQTPPDT